MDVPVLLHTSELIRALAHGHLTLRPLIIPIPTKSASRGDGEVYHPASAATITFYRHPI
jgi:hypothetical protein